MGLQRELYRRMVKMGKMPPKPKREAPFGFSFTKGFGYRSKSGKRSNGTKRWRRNEITKQGEVRQEAHTS